MRLLSLKSKFLLSSVILISFFITPILFAGPRVIGNGGDVLKCEDSRPLELLDYFEATTIREWPIDLGTGISPLEMVEFAIRRFEPFSPARAEMYRSYAANFFEETRFLKNTDLKDIPDSDHIALPKGCAIVQIANQSEPLLIEDKRYLIDDHLWQELPIRDQAGLILHEIIYREALALGHTNSISVRILNALISSSRIEQMSIEEFTILLADLGFESSVVQGVHISFKNPKTGDLTYPAFYPNGTLHFALVAKNSSINFCQTQIQLRDKVEFHESGELKTLTPKSNTRVTCPQLSATLAPYEIHLFSNKNLASLSLAEPTSLNSGQFSGKITGHIKFYENGILQYGESPQGFIHLNKSGAFPIPVKGVIRLRANGQFHIGVLTEEFTYPLGKQMKKWIGPLVLEKDGTLVKGQFSRFQRVRVGNSHITLFAQFVMGFHLNGIPKQACLYEPANLHKLSGQSVSIEKRKVVRFDPQGNFIGSPHEDC